MNKKIALIGTVGVPSLALAKAAIELGHKDIIVFSPEEATKQQPMFTEQKVSYLDLNYTINYPIETQRKQFVCKGKHEYRAEKEHGIEIWICQCGRKI